MKKIIPFAWLCLLPVVLWAQPKLSKDIKIVSGTPYKVVDARVKEYFYDGKDGAVSIKSDQEKVTIQRFSIKSMTEVSRKEYLDLPDKSIFQKNLEINGKLYFMYSVYNKKEKADELFAREVNMADGTFKEPVSIFKTNSPVVLDQTSMSIFETVSKYEIHTSSDNSTLLIKYRTKPEKKSDKENFDVIGFHIYDANLTKKWGAEVKMPYTEKEMNNIAYGVSKSGVAYMVIRNNTSKAIELITVGADKVAKAKKLDLGFDLMFSSLKIKEDAEGSLTCTGFYANGIEVKVSWTGQASSILNINGLMVFKVSAGGDLITKKLYEFPVELINQYESERIKEHNEKREEKGKAGINDLVLTNIAVNPDGSRTIVGEQQYYRVIRTQNSVRYEFYYQDVIVMRIDKDGALTWTKKLPKDQFGGRGKGELSIKYIQGGAYDYILFLDNAKNINLPIEKAPARHVDARGGYLTAFKIDDRTGKLERLTIANIDDINGIEAHQFGTSRIFNAQDKTFLVESYIKGKEDMMFKIVID